MNIEEYRALKVKEEADKKVNVDDKGEAKKEAPSTAGNKETQKVEKEKEVVVTTTPTEFDIDGIGKITLDELKNGYMRNKDYTQKTQTVAQQRKEAEDALALYNFLKSNPEAAAKVKENVKLPNTIDPSTSHVVALEKQLYDFMLKYEIENLQGKYKDFDAKQVLETAHQKGISNLDDAYKLWKTNTTINTPVDVAELEKQIREKVLVEMKNEETGTKTIINTTASSGAVTENKPTITDAEKNVAMKLFRSSKDPVAEYIKWRDIDKVKKVRGVKNG